MRLVIVVLHQQAWTQPQIQWLERIAKQFRENTLADKDALDQGQFKEVGGYKRLNKIFDGQVINVLETFAKQIWQDVAQLLAYVKAYADILEDIRGDRNESGTTR